MAALKGEQWVALPRPAAAQTGPKAKLNQAPDKPPPRLPGGPARPAPRLPDASGPASRYEYAPAAANEPSAPPRPVVAAKPRPGARPQPRAAAENKFAVRSDRIRTPCVCVCVFELMLFCALLFHVDMMHTIHSVHGRIGYLCRVQNWPWESARDPASGDIYYINTSSDETTWDKPPLWDEVFVPSPLCLGNVPAALFPFAGLHYQRSLHAPSHATN